MVSSIVYRRALLTGSCPLAINSFQSGRIKVDKEWQEQVPLELWIVLPSTSQPERWNSVMLCLIFFSYSKSGCRPTFYFRVLHVSIMVFVCNGNFNFSTSLFPFLQSMQIQLSYECHYRLMHTSCLHWPWLCGIWKVVVSKYSHIRECLGGKNVLIKTKLHFLF